MKKYLGIFTLFFLLLTGCSFSTGIDTLIAPPKLSREQEYIYNALKNYTGANISLKYRNQAIIFQHSSSPILTETMTRRPLFFMKKTQFPQRIIRSE